MSVEDSDPDDRHSWERPGAHEVAPGIHRIPLPLPNDGLKAVNVYAVSDGDGLVLIDGGWAMAEAMTALEDGLAELDRTIADIQTFLVTHMHRDHYTQAVAVRRITGSTVSLGAGEKASLDAIHAGDGGLADRSDITALRQAGADELAIAVENWGNERDLSIWHYPDEWLDDGVDVALELRTLRVIATPGHTRGHVVFHDLAADTLFAGDHVLPHITPSIGVELVRPQSPLRDYLASLRLVLAMPDSRLLPAHGPVAPSTHARVEQLLQHHDDRLTATAEAVAAGATTGYEVAGRLGWTRWHRKLADMDEFNTILAVQETMAHLEVLVERGWLSKTMDGAVAHFGSA